MLPESRSPNLVRVLSFEESSLGKKLLMFFDGYGRAIILVCQLVVVLSFLARFWLDEELARLNHNLKAQIAITQSLAPTETELRSVQTQLATIKKIRANSFDAAGVLSTFSQKLPVGIYLTNIAVAKDKLEVSAKSSSLTDFASLVSNLKAVSSFKTIVLKGAQFQSDRQIFSLDLDIKL